MITGAARDWIRDQTGRTVTSAAQAAGGRTNTVWALRFEDGGSAVLRWLPTELWGEAGRRHVRNEALGCQLLASSGLPTPKLLASDPTGITGAYLNLTSWLPGRVRLDPLGPSAIDRLATVAAVLHAVEVPAGRRPAAYRSWAPEQLDVPTWTRRPALWRQALALVQRPAPDGRPVLLHRDFHPGNVLWLGDEISGVIDWAETSWGPAETDVAHACTNFALLHDRASAAAFRRAYERAGGRLEPDREVARFWAVGDLVGFLPDPMTELAALVAQRPDLTPDVVRYRLDLMLAEVLGGR